MRVDTKSILPKRLVNYIHDAGVRAIDNLAESAPESGGLHNLVTQWKAMTTAEKEQFVDGIAMSVVEVIAASALLPVGKKLGRKAVKSAKKAIKRRKKALKKAATAKKGKKKSAKAA